MGGCRLKLTDISDSHSVYLPRILAFLFQMIGKGGDSCQNAAAFRFEVFAGWELPAARSTIWLLASNTATIMINR